MEVNQNYPNPVDDYTYIRVNLTQKSDLSLEIIDMTGKRVGYQHKGTVNAGGHYFEIDARELPSGIYLYKVQAGLSVVTGKMVIRN